ncbi:hypothetical protein G9A89_021814 [Geosiphon pyriformis]|nr:hypothetical protein G9A89_021814 [Geosiphon pyriformis]
MAMEEANHTKLKPAQQLRKKLTNSQRRSKTILPTNNNKDINHPKDEIKITLYHFPITSPRIAITVESLATRKKIAESYNETNKIEQFYYQPLSPAYYPPRPQYQNNYYQPTPQPIQQQYQQPPTQHYQVPARRLITQNQFTPQNRYQVNNSKISSNNQLVSRNTTQPRPNHYHTQPSYLTMPEEQDFHHTALLEANESPFLLSNAAANEQKAITTMYTEAEVEGKPICLILDSGSTGSIITYQLMQQLKRNVNQPAQTVIVIADGMKKTPVGEIDNFLFTLNEITIPVKVLVMDAPQYQALIGNDWLQKANANLNWETQELTISY